MPIDAGQLAALTTFGARFSQLGDLTDPLLAIVEAAQLKGRIDVLLQIGVFELADAEQARDLIDITLVVLLDQHLDARYVDAPLLTVVDQFYEHVRGIGRG